MTKPQKHDLATLNPDELAAYRQQKAERELAAEQARVAQLSDAEVLELSGNGSFGPAIIGQVLFDRAAAVRATTNDGQFGPAITDPDFGKKEAAKRAARLAAKKAAAAAIDDADDELEEEQGDTPDPWSATTLSGAKVLAQSAGVSYNPKIKKADLIAKLKEAGVVPPPLPTDADDDEAE